MYSNQIVRDLEKMLKRWKNLSPEVAMPEYHDQLKRAITLTKSSFQFFLGEFEKMEPLIEKFLYNKKIDTLELFKGKKLNLPYPSFLLCWSFPYEDDKTSDQILRKMYGNTDLKSAMLINQESENVISLQSMTFDIHPDRRRWILSPLISYYTFLDDISKTGFYKEISKKDGDYEHDSENWFIGSTVSSKLSGEMMDDEVTLKVRTMEVSVVNMFLVMSNIPNISTKTIYRDKVKKRKQRKINRLRDYKVLAYKLPSNSPKYRYKEDPNPGKENMGVMPINWYKGHPKTYVRNPDGTGGLGKHHLEGTWWWQPGMRGSKKAGFSDKDYCVHLIND